MNMLTKALAVGSVAFLPFSAAVFADENGSSTSATKVSSNGIALGTGTGGGSWTLTSDNVYTVTDSNTLSLPTVGATITLGTTMTLDQSSGDWGGSITPTSCKDNQGGVFCAQAPVGEKLAIKTATVSGETINIAVDTTIVIPVSLDITYTLTSGSALEALLNVQ